MFVSSFLAMIFSMPFRVVSSTSDQYAEGLSMDLSKAFCGLVELLFYSKPLAKY